MIHALVVAAGQARRFGGDTPKQYLSLTTKSTQTLLQYSVAALAQHKAIGQYTIVVAKDDGFAATLVFAVPVRLVIGGAERWQSVLNGVQQIAKTAHKDDLVLIHDAARPCLSLADLSAVIDVAKKERYGAILATPVVDTLKKGGLNKDDLNKYDLNKDSEQNARRADDQYIIKAQAPSNNPDTTDSDGVYITHTVPRQNLWQAQTPQIYRLGTLLTVLEWIKKQHKTKRHKQWQSSNLQSSNLQPKLSSLTAQNSMPNLNNPSLNLANSGGDLKQTNGVILSNFYLADDGLTDCGLMDCDLVKDNVITDEAMGFEALGLPIRLVAGSASNIKVTYPADMALVQAILLSQGR